MKQMILTLSLLLVSSGTDLQGMNLARHSRGFELIAADGTLKARVFACSDSILLDFPTQQRGYLFKPDFYVYLNRNDKTYRVHSYVSLLAGFPDKANGRLEQQPSESDISVAGYDLTGETEVIAGIRATKLVRTRQGAVKAELWVAWEITPATLRAIARDIRNKLPANYWDNGNEIPSLFQAILVFGVPLRIVDHQSQSDSGGLGTLAIKKKDIPDSLFEIPAEYRQGGD